MTQHTPTPWGVGTRNLSKEEIATVGWVGNCRFGVMTPGIPGGNYRDLTFVSDKEDAAFIVKACNAHADLVEALEAMIKNFRPFTSKPMGTDGSIIRIEQEEQIAVHKMATAVLAKAAS